MKTQMKKVIAIGAAALMAMSMAACNTIAGAGQDLESVGGAVEKTAKDQN